jgi:hypothetical protein
MGIVLSGIALCRSWGARFPAGARVMGLGDSHAAHDHRTLRLTSSEESVEVVEVRLLPLDER